MKVIEVTGLDQVFKNLSGVRRNAGRGAEIGLVKSGHFLMRKSLEVVPIQIGNLKAAWDVRRELSGLRTQVWLGYFGVSYAPYVHEISSAELHRPTHGEEFNIKHAVDIALAQGTWRGTAAGGMFNRRPEESWKFLERPVKENKLVVLKILRDAIRGKIK